jgi:hypothetical protein
MRVLIAGVLGGIAMFIWASIAHVATPLARMGLEAVPNEAAVSAAMHRNLGDKPGLYFIPFAADSAQTTMARQAARLRVEPSALVAYQPPGANRFGRQLGVEFALEVIESILTAALLVVALALGWRRRASRRRT